MLCYFNQISATERINIANVLTGNQKDDVQIFESLYSYGTLEKE
jgi:hypothetical protein